MRLGIKVWVSILFLCLVLEVESCDLGQYSSQYPYECYDSVEYTYTTCYEDYCDCCSAGTRGDGWHCHGCPSGTYSGNCWGSCASCDAGKYSGGGAGSCATCGAGTYSGAGAGSCTSCPANTNSPSGSTSVNQCISTACAAGTTGPAGSCTSCVAGKYKESSGNAACTDCASGKFSGTVGSNTASTCQSCGAGTYSGSGAGSCSTCGAGTYSGGGAGSCSTCGGGTYSGGGAGSCSTCGAGTYSWTGWGSCSSCGAGTYSSAGAGSCTSCPANSNSPSSSTVVGACTCNAGFTGPNGGVCTACVAGKYKTSSGTLACTDCVAGTYSSVSGASSASVCTNCLAGKYSSVSGANSASACSNCLAGTYSAAGAGSCATCGAGTYSAAGAGSCASCPANSNSPSSSSAIGACTCNSGFTGPNGGVCTACVAGKYKTSSGTLACTDCLAGLYSSVSGASSASVCTSCLAGKYSSVSGASSVSACTSCLAGTYSTVSGAVSISTCTTCPIDFHSFPGASSCFLFILNCTACPANAYYAGGVCLACTGNTTSVAGSGACQCKAGFTGGPSNCQACPAGTYKRMAGTSPCRSCQANSVSQSGSALCACGPGYTGNTGDVCVACVAGKYKNVTGPAACTDCAAIRNSPAAAVNVTSCVCNVGYTQVENASMTYDVVYAQACVACAVGKFKALTGVQACTTCAQNQSSVVGSTICACVPGFTGPDGGPCSQCARGTYKDWLGSQACTTCPANTFTTAVGSAVLSQCVCNTGYTGPDGITCVACVPGKYKNVTGSSACPTCPTSTESAIGSNSISLCQCMSSFTGPDGGPCQQCESGKYKNWPNSSACSMCDANSESTGGMTLCKCRAGYTERLGYTGVVQNNGDKYDLLQACGSSETERCRILGCGDDPVTSLAKFNDKDFTEQSMGGIHCNLQGISPLPIDFGREKIVTSVVVYIERGWCNNHFCGCKYTVRVGNTPPGLYPDTNNELLCPAMKPANSPLVTISGWVMNKFTIDCGSTLRGRYFTLNKELGGACYASNFPHELQVMGLRDYTACVTCAPGLYKNKTMSNDVCTTCPANSYEPDLAATLVTNCSCNAGYEGANGGPCLACPVGKYKDTNGTAPCVSCPADTYIDVQGSAFCKSCPKFTTSPVGSTSIDSCMCKMGYTYDAVADTADPLSTVLATSPAYLMTSAEAWDSANSRFTDLSGNGRHGTLTAGTVSVGKATGNGAGWSIAFVEGTTPTTIQWPAASIPSTFTICSITRYTGGASNRILDAGATWYHGHHANKGGSIFYGLTNLDAFGFSTSPITNWVIACGRNIETPGAIGTISNGVVTSTAMGGMAGDGRLRINTWGEKSDWQLSRLYVWNRHLTNAEFAEASAKLNSYVGLRMPSYYFCSSCAIGKYKDTLGSALCTSCPANTYSAESNATSVETCLTCPGNSTSVVASMSKDYCQCNVGFLHAGEDCAECLPGTYNPRLAQIACSNCTVGTYSLNYGATSNETCASCSGTEYSPEGSPVCLPCPANSVAPARSGRIQDCGCIIGYTGASASLCEKCAPGTFKNITGNFLCETCSANSYSLSGATALTACFCNPGYTGTYGPLCVACALGKYKSVYGNSTCIDCPANTYADRTGMTVCSSCVNTSASAVASTSIWNCTCNAGYRGPTYEEVTATDNFARSCGTLRNSACKATQSSTWTAEVAVGVYDFVNPAQSANDNSVSTFSATTLNSNQWWRVDFERRVTVTSVKILFKVVGVDSLYVHVGDVNTSTSNLICAVISLNLTVTDWMTVQCSSALTGRYLFVRNAVASQMAIYELSAQGTEVLVKVFPEFCQGCPVGTYKSLAGDLPCIVCPANSFSTSVAATNSSTCKSCAANSVSQAGSAACTCDVGFAGVPGNCNVCFVTTFKSTTGPSTCEVCPVNSVIAPNASFVLEPCVCVSGFEPV